MTQTLGFPLQSGHIDAILALTSTIRRLQSFSRMKNLATGLKVNYYVKSAAGDTNLKVLCAVCRE